MQYLPIRSHHCSQSLAQTRWCTTSAFVPARRPRKSVASQTHVLPAALQSVSSYQVQPGPLQLAVVPPADDQLLLAHSLLDPCQLHAPLVTVPPPRIPVAVSHMRLVHNRHASSYYRVRDAFSPARLHQTIDDAPQASYCVFSQRLGRLGKLSAFVLYQSIKGRVSACTMGNGQSLCGIAYHDPEIRCRSGCSSRIAYNVLSGQPCSTLHDLHWHRTIRRAFLRDHDETATFS